MNRDDISLVTGSFNDAVRHCRVCHQLDSHCTCNSQDQRLLLERQTTPPSLSTVNEEDSDGNSQPHHKKTNSGSPVSVIDLYSHNENECSSSSSSSSSSNSTSSSQEESPSNKNHSCSKPAAPSSNEKNPVDWKATTRAAISKAKSPLVVPSTDNSTSTSPANNRSIAKPVSPKSPIAPPFVFRSEAVVQDETTAALPKGQTRIVPNQDNSVVQHHSSASNNNTSSPTTTTTARAVFVRTKSVETAATNITPSPTPAIVVSPRSCHSMNTYNTKSSTIVSPRSKSDYSGPVDVDEVSLSSSCNNSVGDDNVENTIVPNLNDRNDIHSTQAKKAVATEKPTIVSPPDTRLSPTQTSARQRKREIESIAAAAAVTNINTTTTKTIPEANSNPDSKSTTAQQSSPTISCTKAVAVTTAPAQPMDTDSGLNKMRTVTKTTTNIRRRRSVPRRDSPITDAFRMAAATASRNFNTNDTTTTRLPRRPSRSPDEEAQQDQESQPLPSRTLPAQKSQPVLTNTEPKPTPSSDTLPTLPTRRSCSDHELPVSIIGDQSSYSIVDGQQHTLPLLHQEESPLPQEDDSVRTPVNPSPSFLALDRRRGVDSPMKVVDTKNAFKSAIRHSSKSNNRSRTVNVAKDKPTATATINKATIAPFPSSRLVGNTRPAAARLSQPANVSSITESPPTRNLSIPMTTIGGTMPSDGNKQPHRIGLSMSAASSLSDSSVESDSSDDEAQAVPSSRFLVEGKLRMKPTLEMIASHQQHNLRRMLPKHGSSFHRRTNTNDSTNSAVAAVVRGASQAAKESVDPALTLDRPMARPRRQQTAGSDTFPSVSSKSSTSSNAKRNKNDMDSKLDDKTNAEKASLASGSNTNSQGPVSKTSTNKVAVAGPRPPRHDCNNNKVGDERTTIDAMKQSTGKKTSSLPPKAVTPSPTNRSGADKPMAYPYRQSTAEKPPLSVTSVESSSNSFGIREITVTPESLLEKFGPSTASQDQKDSIPADARDDDSFALVPLLFDQSPTKSTIDDVAPETTTTSHPTLQSPSFIQAWLNMPQRPQLDRWGHSSEPILNVPRDLVVPRRCSSSRWETEEVQSGPRHHRQSEPSLWHPGECRFPQDTTNSSVSSSKKEDEDGGDNTDDDDDDAQHKFWMTPVPSREDINDDDVSSQNVTGSQDDRMFQAWANMPPRACTTHYGHLGDSSPIPCGSYYNPLTDVAELWVAAASTPNRSPGNVSSIGNNSRCINIKEDASGIDLSVDLSLPSFFDDCRGFNDDCVLINNSNHLSLDNSTIGRNSSLHSISRQSVTSTSRMAEAAAAEMQRRLSLPPPMPHRRKPSLVVDDSAELEAVLTESTKAKRVASPLPAKSYDFQSIVPASPRPPPVPNRNRNLRAAWPRMQRPTDGPTHSSAPTISNRHRRQDSLLSTEAGCETMVPGLVASAVQKIMQRNNTNGGSNQKQLITPKPRASTPPLQPRCRQPTTKGVSLTEPIPKTPVKDEPNPPNWNCSPVTVGTDNQSHGERAASASMIHQRKPSLNILEDGGDEGMIEMWLSSPHSQYYSSHNSLHGSGHSSVHYHRSPENSFLSTPATSPNSSPTHQQTTRPIVVRNHLYWSPRPNLSNHQKHDSWTSEVGSIASLILKDGEVEI